jgi:hypothetical protein
MRSSAFCCSLSLLIVSLNACSSSATQVITSKECGVAFTLPAGWTASREPPENPPESPEAKKDCKLDLRPADWRSIAAKSMWDVPDPPLRLTLFSRATSYEAALDEEDFAHNDEGDPRLGMDSFRGTFVEATPYREGSFSGHAVTTFFRGYLREGFHTTEKAPVFSGGINHLVLRSKQGERVLAFVCDEGTPDEPVNCDLIERQILRTLTFR